MLFLTKGNSFKKSIITAGLVAGVCFMLVYFNRTILNVDSERAQLREYADDIVAQIGDSLLSETESTIRLIDSVGRELKSVGGDYDTLLVRKLALSVLNRNGAIDGVFVMYGKGTSGAIPAVSSAYFERVGCRVIARELLLPNGSNQNFGRLMWSRLNKVTHADAWVAPYFNPITKKRAAAYIRIIKLSDSLYCYVGADYSISKIYSFLNGWKAGRIGYPYLMNSEGEFVAHPNNDTRTLEEIGISYGEKMLVRLARNIRRGEAVNPSDFYHLNTVSKAMCWEKVVYIPKLKWYLGVSVADQQVYSNPLFFNVQRRDKILCSFYYFGGLLLFEVLLLLLLLKKEEVASMVGVALLIILIVEIILLCHISTRYPSIKFSDMEINKRISQKNKLLSEGLSASKDTQKLSERFDRWNFAMLLDREGVSDYTKLYFQSFRGKSEVKTLLVPTGLYVLTVKFTDSYTTSIAGYVWQTIPYGCGVKPGVLFPDAENVLFDQKDSSLVTADNGESSVYYRWHFSMSIRESFDYSHFPFDYNDLWIRIWHADFDRNVILVPDFKSYSLIHPSFKPGLDNDIVIPGWNIEGTYYSFKEKNYCSSFDTNHAIFKEGFPELHYNVILKRDYVDTIITRIIPIAVLLFMTYSILYIARRRDALDVAIACAGLLFVAVFEHVSLRRNLDVSGIIYMEYYYFAVYLLLMLVAVSTILNDRFSKVLPRYLSFSQLSIIMYWPLALLIILFATIFIFY